MQEVESVMSFEDGESWSERIAKAEGRKEVYRAYLASHEWRRRRDLVFGRAMGVCEGCRERECDEVHHLSYDNIGDEFLWELVAICRECHERVHKISRGDTPRERHQPQIRRRGETLQPVPKVLRPTPWWA